MPLSRRRAYWHRATGTAPLQTLLHVQTHPSSPNKSLTGNTTPLCSCLLRTGEGSPSSVETTSDCSNRSPASFHPRSTRGVLSWSCFLLVFGIDFPWLDRRAFLQLQFRALGHSPLTQMQHTWVLKVLFHHFPLFARIFLEVDQEEGGTKPLF